LITGIFGLILTIQLDYDLPFQMPVNLLFWHVEAGIVMTLISLFHIGWHFKYYANLLRTSRSKARAAEARERAFAQRPTRQGQVAMTAETVRQSERRQPGWESL
jgi:cytochrome b561